MNTFYHRNFWNWGRSTVITMHSGRAVVRVSVANEEKDIAWISGLSVIESSRNNGYGSALLELAIYEAKKLRAKKVRIAAEVGSFTEDWYKRFGFAEIERNEELVTLEQVIGDEIKCQIYDFHTPPKFCVKISVSMLREHIVEEVAYFNYGLPMDVFERYKWYYEYLAARIKVKNPKRRVELEYGHCEVPCGQDWIDIHLPKRLQWKRRELKKLTNPNRQDDLFGFTSSSCAKKAAGVQKEIEALERGEYNYYVPPTYINKIKKWI